MLFEHIPKIIVIFFFFSKMHVRPPDKLVIRAVKKSERNFQKAINVNPEGDPSWIEGYMFP